MLRDELRDEVLQLRRLTLWTIREVVVLNSLRPPDVVNADHEGFQVAVRPNCEHVERHKTHRDERHDQQRHLQVRVHDERRAEQLDILALGIFNRRRFIVSNRRVHRHLLSPPTELISPDENRSQDNQGCSENRVERSTEAQTCAMDARS